MKDAGITQSILAERMDKSQSAIAHWLGGNRKPSIEEIATMMKIVGLSRMTLNSDGYVEPLESSSPNSPMINFETNTQLMFPVLDAVQAGNWTWTSASNAGTKEISKWLATTEKASGKSFWLQVEGESMTSASGVSFPEGTLILVDTEKDHNNGSLVIAKLANVDEVTFKKLIVDAGQKFLKSLNPVYPTISIDANCRIVGVIVDAKLPIY
ncbi:LexA family transcriptional regulator [Vibrio sp. Y2-5]|uniref:LexA family protein n=1 Tax=Vibrio sp. Y2-5 TaxID=2743977 RepID=UPI001CB6C9BB|nr:LexA family transcriptional regulator [Vibrio sp. Y2-5]